RPSQGSGGRGDRRAASEMGRAAAAGRRAEEGSGGQQGRDSLVHAGQDRQMVDAGRRRLRRGNPPHRDRQDPENRTARALQGLPAADRRGVSAANAILQKTTGPGIRARAQKTTSSSWIWPS